MNELDDAELTGYYNRLLQYGKRCERRRRRLLRASTLEFWQRKLIHEEDDRNGWVFYSLNDEAICSEYEKLKEKLLTFPPSPHRNEIHGSIIHAFFRAIDRGPRYPIGQLMDINELLYPETDKKTEQG